MNYADAEVTKEEKIWKQRHFEIWNELKKEHGLSTEDAKRHADKVIAKEKAEKAKGYGKVKKSEPLQFGQQTIDIDSTEVDDDNTPEQIKQGRKARAKGVYAAYKKVTEDKDDEFYTPPDKLRLGVAGLKEAIPGAEMIFTNQGKFGGIEIGIPAAPDKINGINFPSDFKYLKCGPKMNETAMQGILKKAGKAFRSFWYPMFLGRKSEASESAPLYDVLQQYKSISIDGNLAFKFIPKLEWFEPHLRDISPYEYFHAFNKAEVDVLLLHIGKLAIGAPTGVERESELVEIKKLNFHYRTAICMHGDAGVGKSTYIKELLTALGQCGYDHGTPANTANQFAWGDNLYKDAAVFGDINNKGLSKILESDIKSVISGDLVSDERKQIQGKTGYPRTTVFMATNEIRLEQDIDAGMIDRMAFLQTKTKEQLKAEVPAGENFDTYSHHQAMATKYGCSVECLTLLMVRKALDKFLEEINVAQNEQGEWQQAEKKQIKLVEKIRNLKENFIFQLSEKNTNVLTRANRKANLLTQSLIGMTDEVIEVPRDYDTNFHIFQLYHTIKTNLHLDNIQIDLLTKAKEETLSEDEQNKLSLVTDLLNWLGIQELIPYTTAKHFCSNVETHANNMGVEGTEQGLEKVWKRFIPDLTNAAGDPVEQHRPTYNSDFKIHKSNAVGYSVDLRGIVAKHLEYIQSSDTVIDELCVRFINY